MHKPSYLLFFFILVVIGPSSTLYGQSVRWGSPVEPKKNMRIVKWVGETASGAYYLYRGQSEGQYSSGHYRIEKYTPHLDFEFSEELELPRSDNVPHLFQKTFLWQDSLWMVTTAYNKKNKQRTAFLTPISPDGKLASVPLEVDRISENQIRNTGSFEFRLSENKQRLLIFHKMPYQRDKDEVLFFKALNPDRSVYWERILNLPYKRRDFKMLEYRLDANGHLFILGKITNQEMRWAPGKPNYYYTLLHLDPQRKDLQQYEINLGNKSITDAVLRFEENGQVLVTGLYSKKAARPGDAGGYFYVQIDPAKGILTGKGKRSLPNLLMRSVIGDKQVEKGNEPSHFKIHSCFPVPEGGFVLLSERQYMIPVCYTDQRTGFETCNDNFYYADILAIMVDKKGEMKWAKHIKKEQLSVNDDGYYSSFVSCYANGSVHCIYNDNAFNLGLKGKEKHRPMNNARKAIVVRTTIDANGEINSEKLFDAPDPNFIFRPKINHYIHPGKVLVYGVQKRGFRIGIIGE